MYRLKMLPIASPHLVRGCYPCSSWQSEIHQILQDFAGNRGHVESLERGIQIGCQQAESAHLKIGKALQEQSGHKSLSFISSMFFGSPSFLTY